MTLIPSFKSSIVKELTPPLIVRRYTALICSICLCFSHSSLFSQTDNFHEEWRWVHFTTESGLPSNHVFNLLETPSGVVWAATSEGCAWFDGFQWHLVDSSRGLPQLGVKAIVTKDDENVFVLLGQQVFMGSTTAFKFVVPEHVWSMAALPNRQLLVYRQKSSSLHAFHRDSLSIFKGKETEGKTVDLIQTSSGSIWINTQSGLYRLIDTSLHLRIRVSSDLLAINSITEDQTGTGLMSIGSPFDQRGLWEWKNGGFPVLNKAEKGDKIKSMDISPDGQVVAIHQSGEVRIREQGTWHSLSPVPQQMKKVEFVQFRPNGDLWVGGEKGLFLFRKSSPRWTFLKHNSPDPRNRIHEILRRYDGSLWFATAEGIDVLYPDGAERSIRDIMGRRLSVVTGLAEDDSGFVWISSGSDFEGSYRWDGKQWQYFRISENTHRTHFHKIRKDKNGRLWFLGLAKDFPLAKSKEPGAFVYEHGRFTQWGIAQGLRNGRVYSFDEGPDGSLWFGTAAGLNRWKKGIWTCWTEQNGLRTDRIFTLAVDNDNTVWFSDQHTGLGYIDRSDSVHYFNVGDGLISENIWDLKVDSVGRLWIATGNGLGSYFRGRWSAFGVGSGLDLPQLWPVLPIGDRVYVGSANGGGVGILNLSEADHPPPRISLEQPIVENSTALVRWQPFAYWGEVSPGDILSRFRIDDQPWSQWNSLRDVKLDVLESGLHTLRVQAQGLFGNYDSLGEQCSFEIPLPLHRRLIFLAPIGGLTLMVIGLGVIMRVRKRKHVRIVGESEMKFQRVMELTTSAIFIYDESIFLYVNPFGESLTGYSRKEILAMPVQAIIPRQTNNQGNDAQPLMVHHRFEFALKTKNGDLRWIDFTEGSLPYQGRIVTLGTAFDITERKNNEAKVRQSEKRYRTLFESNPNPTFVYNIETLQFLAVNNAAVAHYGYTREEFLKMTLKDILPVEDVSRFLNRDSTVPLHLHKADSWRQMRKNGSLIDVELTAHDILFSGRKARLVIVNDVTDRKKANERLYAYQKQLRSLASDISIAEERQRRKMATYLHDTIGQALAFCKFKMGLIQEMTQSKPLYDSFQEVRSLIDESIQNTRSLTFELSPPILHELDFIAVVEWLVDQLRHHKSIAFHIKNDGQAKSLKEDLRVVLFQTVRELLVNIVKHSNARNVHIWIGRERDDIQICIQDDGTGFDSPPSEHLTGNGGFGLFNIRERINELDGFIRIESAHGRGTQVFVTAPLFTSDKEKPLKE